jgi:hypothetical protein
MRRVIVETPYAGKSHWRIIAFFQRTQNRRYARAAVRDSLMRGETPIASHLIYTQPGILRDEIEGERQQGIDAGLAWRGVAESSVVTPIEESARVRLVSRPKRPIRRI